jgi:signal transduction histidine kinase
MMKAYAEMIRDLSGDDPVKRNKHLQIVIDETDRLTALVNDILDLSKLENGSMELEIKDFDITEKMKSIYSRYVEFSKKQDFHIFFDAPESHIVRCDEGKIERVICNLINNAVNYTAGDRNVYVRERITAEGVLIEVEDTGDGIEEDKIKLIFDKYYRSENHKRETIGTGLGLSIVKTILKMHGYRFGVKSTLGVGTVFWFIISDIDDMDSKK